MNLRIGSTVDNYVVEGFIAEGGMSQVYLARHQARDTLHALKVLHHQSRDVRARLHQEGHLQRLLQHPNIVPVTEVISVGHAPALVMDYVRGPDLAELIARCRLSDSDIEELVRGVLRGIIAAHANGMVHRDLKPSNILLEVSDRRLTPRITDFGLAKTWSGGGASPTTHSGIAMGTPCYMAPEQIWDASTVDARADIFSLGAILYELFSGARAFDAEHSVAIWSKITSGAFAPLGTLRPDLPVEMLQVVHQAMAADLDHRISDGETLLNRWNHACAALDHSRKPGIRDSDPSRIAMDFVREREQRMKDLIEANTAGPDDLTTTIYPFVIDGLDQLDPDHTQPSPDLQARYPIESRLKQAPSNLPVQVDRFIGRSQELSALWDHLQESRPIVTLSGPGGMGKTRLSLALAEQHRSDFQGGVWFCDLTEARDEDDILRSVAQALRIPLSEHKPAMQLAHAIDGRGPLLLILDNMEQVVDCANQTVGMWARHAPAARFLVTSRIRLGLQSERMYVLGPIDLEDGIQLFVERARDHQPDYALTAQDREAVEEIVACLDGMCLAIELAAARSALLSPAQILDRLNERFTLLRSGDSDRTPRQSTLQGTIDWSWNLLTPVDQAALAQCSIFRGGFTLAAAEKVLDLEPFGEWVLDVLQSLVEQSLLRSTEPMPGAIRFQMYESIQEYALEKMCTPESVETEEGQTHTGPDALRALAHRHSCFYSQLGDPMTLEEQFEGGDVESRSRIRMERDNLLHAMTFGQGHPFSEIQALATAALATIHRWYGPFAPALGWVLTGLKRDDLSPACRLQLTTCASGLYWNMAKTDEAVQKATEALEIARILKDVALEGDALRNLADLDYKNRSVAERMKMLYQALELIRSAGDSRAEIGTLLALSAATMKSARITLALAYAEEALQLARAKGFRQLEARALRFVAGCYLDVGKPAQAETSLKESLELAQHLDQAGLIGRIYAQLGTLYKATGRLEDSVQVHKDGIQITREMGAMRDECILLGNLALILQLQGEPEDARILYEDTMALTDATGMSDVGLMARGNLGDLLLSQGQLEEAVPYLEAAITGFDTYQDITSGAFRGSLAWVRAQLGDLEAAMVLLDAGEAQLRGAWMFELGRLLCRRAQVLHIHGEHAGADAALAEARDIASKHGGSPDSDLGQLIGEAERALEG